MEVEDILADVMIILIEIKPPIIIAINKSILAILRSFGLFHFFFTNDELF